MTKRKPPVFDVGDRVTARIDLIPPEFYRGVIERGPVNASPYYVVRTADGERVTLMPDEITAVVPDTDDLDALEAWLEA